VKKVPGIFLRKITKNRRFRPVSRGTKKRGGASINAGKKKKTPFPPNGRGEGGQRGVHSFQRRKGTALGKKTFYNWGNGKGRAFEGKKKKKKGSPRVRKKRRVL